jgi:hypothetical protein
MADRITEISFDRPVVQDDGSLTLQSRTFFKTIINQALIIGTGSPEGVVEAEQGANYMDDAGTASNLEYRKQKDNIGGDKSLGWVLK